MYHEKGSTGWKQAEAQGEHGGSCDIRTLITRKNSGLGRKTKSIYLSKEITSCKHMCDRLDWPSGEIKKTREDNACKFTLNGVGLKAAPGFEWGDLKEPLLSGYQIRDSVRSVICSMIGPFSFNPSDNGQFSDKVLISNQQKYPACSFSLYRRDNGILHSVNVNYDHLRYDANGISFDNTWSETASGSRVAHNFEWCRQGNHVTFELDGETYSETVSGNGKNGKNECAFSYYSRRNTISIYHPVTTECQEIANKAKQAVKVEKWEKDHCYFELTNGFRLTVTRQLKQYGQFDLDATAAAMSAQVEDAGKNVCGRDTPLIFEQSTEGGYPNKVLICNGEEYLRQCSFTLYKKDDNGVLYSKTPSYKHLQYNTDGATISFDKTWDVERYLRTVEQPFAWCKHGNLVSYNWRGKSHYEEVSETSTSYEAGTMCNFASGKSVSIYLPITAVETVCQRIAKLAEGLNFRRDATPCQFELDGVKSPLIAITPPAEIGIKDEAKLKAAKADVEKQIAAVRAARAEAKGG